jgi:hypothetical protein
VFAGLKISSDVGSGTVRCPEESVASQRPMHHAVLHGFCAVDEAAHPTDVSRLNISGLELHSLVSKLGRASAAYQSSEDEVSSVNPSAELALKMRQIRSGCCKKFGWKALMKDEPSLCFNDPFPPEPVYGTVLSVDDGDESLRTCETGDAIASHATLDSIVEGESSVHNLLWRCPEILSPNRTSHYEYCKVKLLLLALFNTLSCI